MAIKKPTVVPRVPQQGNLQTPKRTVLGGITGQPMQPVTRSGGTQGGGKDGSKSGSK
jgi:hypothetical protein